MNRSLLRLLAVGVVGALLLAPMTALADEHDPAPEPQAALEAALEQIQAIADEAGVDVEDVLAVELPFAEDGEEDLTVTFEEALERVLGTSLIDEANSGWQGTPWANAGNVMHVAANLIIEEHGVIPRSEDPPLPQAQPYVVSEAELTPDTPIVPVINPLLLAALVTGESIDDPLNLPLLLFTHWGGRLKNVQGGGNVLSAHSAGSHLIGTNLDTAERPEGDDATFPFYAPVIDDGTLLLSDEEIDFLGFATVVNTGSCSRTSLNIPFTQNKYVLDVCVGVGLLLGDGVSFFNGEGPVDFRTDLAPLWEPAPEEAGPVVEALDEAIAQIPVDDILEAVLDAVGGVDTPEPPDPPEPSSATSAGALLR